MKYKFTVYDKKKCSMVSLVATCYTIVGQTRVQVTLCATGNALPVFNFRNIITSVIREALEIMCTL